MNDLLMFLYKVNSSECINASLLNLLRLVRLAIRILQIAIPIGLILMGTLDMGKAVIAGDEKKIKEARKPFVSRLISAVIVFCIPFIITLVMSLITKGNTDWANCWNAAGNSDFTKITTDIKTSTFKD